MSRWEIEQTLTYFDVYEVEAESEQEARRLHAAGMSNQQGMTYSEGEVLAVTEVAQNKNEAPALTDAPHSVT